MADVPRPTTRDGAENPVDTGISLPYELVRWIF